jgi:hypothetical protein
VHRDLDGDLLALLHDEQVEVLEEALDRVALDLLGQGERLLAVDGQRQQGVHAAVLEREHGVVTGEGDVHGVAAVAVEDGGNLVGAADAAGGALAELGARLGLDVALGHGV